MDKKQNENNEKHNENVDHIIFERLLLLFIYAGPLKYVCTWASKYCNLDTA